ncbi:hypothetical protein JCM19233_325 [Vibrio astriarenae]|nr:hypothetical protein JCM19233_325 [Vibrio sp. C7]
MGAIAKWCIRRVFATTKIGIFSFLGGKCLWGKIRTSMGAVAVGLAL